MAGIVKRGSGFRITVSMGYGMDGRQQRRTTTFMPPEGVTEGKARKLAAIFAHDFERQCQGITSFSENMRFYELADWYFDIIAPSILKETTLHRKRNMVSAYLIPRIGRYKLKDITATRLDELWLSLKESGRLKSVYRLKDPNALPKDAVSVIAGLSGIHAKTINKARHNGTLCKESAQKIAEACGKKTSEMFTPANDNQGLNAYSVADIRRILSSIFSAAVKKEIVAKNPVTNSTPPKAEKKERPFLDDSQCIRLLEVLKTHKNPQLRAMLTTLLYSGLRSGELLALCWADINFDANIISVRHTLSRVKGRYELTTPKTKGSQRHVIVDSVVMDVLKEHKAWRERRKESLGERWTENGAVFTAKYGDWYSSAFLNRLFKQLLSGHNFPNVRIHDLRHACASLMINAGVPTKAVSDYLGHSNTRITEEVYAHIFAKTRAQACEAISNALKGDKVDK